MSEIAKHKLKEIEHCAMCCHLMKCDILVSGSLRVFEVREASRQGLEDLRCNVKVGLTSDSMSGSTREIMIASLVTSLLDIRDKVLDMLPERNNLHATRDWSNIVERFSAYTLTNYWM